RRRPALEEAGGGQPGPVRYPSTADRLFRRPPLPCGKAGSRRTDGGGDRRARSRSENARNRAHALRPEADPGSPQTRRTADPRRTGLSSLPAVSRVQKVEIAAQVRLGDVVQEEPSVTAVVVPRRRHEPAQPPLDLRLRE